MTYISKFTFAIFTDYCASNRPCDVVFANSSHHEYITEGAGAIAQLALISSLSKTAGVAKIFLYSNSKNCIKFSTKNSFNGLPPASKSPFTTLNKRQSPVSSSVQVKYGISIHYNPIFHQYAGAICNTSSACKSLYSIMSIMT